LGAAGCHTCAYLSARVVYQVSSTKRWFGRIDQFRLRHIHLQRLV